MCIRDRVYEVMPVPVVIYSRPTLVKHRQYQDKNKIKDTVVRDEMPQRYLRLYYLRQETQLYTESIKCNISI